VQNLTKWKIDNTKMQELGGIANTAKSAYSENINPEEKNRRTSKTKIEAFSALREYMSIFTLTLIANLNIGDDDLAAMGIRPRKRHAYMPLPTPPHAPNLEVISGQHHEVSAYASIPQLGHSTTYLKDHGVFGIRLRTRLEGESEWRERDYTRVHVSLAFNDEDVGKHLSVAVAWINPRLENGPWSDTITVIIN
jgi:hypothetical protein